MKQAVSVQIQDSSDQLNAALKKLAKSSVYVGIATGSKGDKRDDGAPDNSLLGFVHENGSPANGIPPRPFLVPAIEQSKEAIVSSLKRSMKAALEGDAEESSAELERLALKSAAIVKDYMQTADFVPLKPSTIANRNRSRLTQSSRKNELSGGNIQPLINTGQLRNAIDGYVVEE